MNGQAGLIRVLAILATAGLALMAGCGGGAASGTALAAQQSSGPPSPPPATTQLTGMDVSPYSVTLGPGDVQQFTATISPRTLSQAVTWSLSGTGCTGAGCGTVDATGKYTAPAAGANVPFFVLVTAVPAASTDWSRSAVVTVSMPTSDNVKLSGRYAVLLRGSIPDEAPELTLLGSLVADGNGNLTAGAADMNPFNNMVFYFVSASRAVGIGPSGNLTVIED